MEKFLSCDWGTSFFRLRLIDVGKLEIIAEEYSSEGIAQTFQLWKECGKKEEERQSFYLSIIIKHIKTIEKKVSIFFDDLPLIISGMASANIGIIDLPYKNLPFAVSSADLEVFIIEKPGFLKNKVIIISGAKTEDDVMRGEETKLVGCAFAAGKSDNHVYIFPGTHPKHVEVKNGNVTAFKTYMTGEFFDLLSNKSILAASIEKSEDFEAQNNLQSFTKGVTDSQNSHLLHSCFLVRTNHLFRKNSPKENYFYLSGLLIGSELGYLKNESRNITIAGNETLNAQYTIALSIITKNATDVAVKNLNADKALIKGQLAVYQQIMKSKEFTSKF